MTHLMKRYAFVVWLLGTSLGGVAVAQEIGLEPLWVAQSGAPIYGRPALDEKHLYVGGDDGIMRAYDKATGDVVWRYDAGAAIGSSAAVDPERVYFSAWDGSVHAVMKSDGTPDWRFATEGEKRWDTWDHILSTPVVDHERVYFGSGDHHIYGLNKRNGSLRWKVKTGGIIHSEAALDGDRLIVGSFDGKLYGVDRANGELLWTFKTVGNAYFRNGAISSSPVIHDGVAYVGARDYNIYAVLTATGTGAWNYRTPSWVVAKPILLDDTVYFAISNSPQMIAVDAQSGDEKWNTPLSLNVYGRAVGIGQDYVAAAGDDGRVQLVARDGSGVVAIYDAPIAAANRAQYFDGEEMKVVQYTSFTHFEDVYHQMLEDLGGVKSGLVAEGNVIYYSGASGEIVALEVTGVTVPQTEDQ